MAKTKDLTGDLRLRIVAAHKRTVREVRKNPRITTKAILVNLGSAGGNVSRQTFQRTLHIAGFNGADQGGRHFSR
ncbi:putative alpha-N-acetylgalactosaminide alpha-2-6-sialyltransferase 1-like [Scophthalmus maximus]|uniref:Putative alpha-N-acetylgalactosaminide alpha-2-6-sialyltransferase 1-like n=1 Tax=Scophthalmus maximus TaxID=52904 RepID=A0A2U9CWP2_SCOMX|nr:putative alpha-N-acetylgalactosaminide alpha-2-6-sialyltransferase 1-like [Scophthalmus maximus]